MAINPGGGSIPRTKVLFLSDLDGTWLSKNPKCREDLDRGVIELKDEYRKKGIDLEFGYVTARPPERVSAENLPDPDWTITDNGGFIHRGDPVHVAADGTTTVDPELPAWEAINESSGFNSSKTADLARKLKAEPEYQNLKLQTVGQVVGNPAADACPALAALCFEESSIMLNPAEMADTNHNGIPDIFEKESFQTPLQLDRFKADLQHELDKRHVHYQVSPTYPFLGKAIAVFDVTSPAADKGNAVEFLMNYEHVTPDHLIVSGDGGNDIAMMRAKDGSDDGRRAIVVGGEDALYQAASKLRHAILQPPSMDCSEAVLDGLRRHLQEIAAEGAPQPA